METAVVSVYGKRATVNKKNPSFNTWTGEENSYVLVQAICGDETGEWREQFKVTSLAVAEEQIREVIQFFNDTRVYPDKERERHFVSLYAEDEEVRRYRDDGGLSGWLDPNGTFHPCGFGEHVKYALDFAEKAGEEFRVMGSEDIEKLNANQHIPMSLNGQSASSFIGILADLTAPQIEWFNRFFFKLAPMQRSVVCKKAKEQGVKLKYQW
ncbi:hypothetical protein [Paenibacillus xylanexedens]|uniref:hypothetical protein n=1 Tax=Paenibacillus xylanexedens TaxID=528191 RepID=UPI000F524333|nr:hypothetical protein [Paenibacillus xylanexedens]RPK19989.1 hypothetical protein EDO6_06506 [Paenibacillus xylanexedens]